MSSANWYWCPDWRHTQQIAMAINQPLLSIIIPAYNEEERLPQSLERIGSFVAGQPYSTEVLVVNDGSQDNTAGIAGDFRRKYPFLSLIDKEHRGKGHTVKTGMMAAQGQYLFACDSDLSMPIEEVSKFLPPALDGYDVAIASREVPGARRYGEPFYRHIMGRVFNLIVRLLTVPGVQDTQCGFKSFRREVAQAVFPYQTIDGWSFDVEILFIARKYGYQITEVPINWYYMERSQIKPLTDTVNMLREVLRVRRNDRLGLYDKR
jgi:dolichyl-phosphate beta-glucosyltransferase